MAIGDIKHVVILMQENRSFDQYFGTFPGVIGFSDPNFVPQSQSKRPCLPFRASTFSSNAEDYFGDDHSWNGMHNAYSSSEGCLPVATNLPVDSYNEQTIPLNPPLTTYPGYGYYAANDIPYHWVLASTFGLCDQWFASALAPTATNRLYLMSGCIRDPNGASDSTPSDLGTQTINDPPPNGLPWQSFPADLAAQKPSASWKVYDETDQGGVNPAYYAVSNPQNSPNETYSGPLPTGTFVYPPSPLNGWGSLNVLRFFSNAISQNNYAGGGDFVSDAISGKLPTISWLIQPFGASEWQGNHPSDGAQYIAQKLDAILGRTSDGAALAGLTPVWPNTVFIIMYDENDSAFDHVPPTVPSPPGTVDNTVEAYVNGLPIGAGYRVPAMIISPWTVNAAKNPGWDVSGGAPTIQHQRLDHTAVIQLLELITQAQCLSTGPSGAQKQNIGTWRQSEFACQDFWNSLFASAPPANLDAVRAMIPPAGDVQKYQLNAQSRMLPYMTGSATATNFPNGPPSVGRNPLYLPAPSPNAPWPPVQQQIQFLELSQTSFSSSDAQAVAQSTGSASFAFALVLDGFEPNELAGLVQSFNVAPPSPLPRNSYPTLYLAVLAGNNPAPDVQVQNVTLVGESGAPPPIAQQAISPAISQAQRWTVSFDLVFTDPVAAFASVPVTLALTATFSSNLDWSTSIPIQLVAVPDPFMLAGGTSYLSRDLRVFEVVADGNQQSNAFGVAFNPGDDPADWITNIIQQLNNGALPAFTGLFDTDPGANPANPQPEAPYSAATLSQTAGADLVYNFAIARVTLQGVPPPDTATNVQVFFRLFPAPSLGTAYSSSYYPTQPATAQTSSGTITDLELPVPARTGSDFLSIPFFATRRSVVRNINPDTPNLQTSISTTSAQPVYTYFGCWLDINDPTATIEGQSLMSLVMNPHQCLVAQIAFPGLTIGNGAVPGVDTDKLAQRNLAVGTSSP